MKCDLISNINKCDCEIIKLIKHNHDPLVFIKHNIGHEYRKKSGDKSKQTVF